METLLSAYSSRPKQHTCSSQKKKKKKKNQQQHTYMFLSHLLESRNIIKYYQENSWVGLNDSTVQFLSGLYIIFLHGLITSFTDNDHEYNTFKNILL